MSVVVKGEVDIYMHRHHGDLSSLPVPF